MPLTFDTQISPFGGLVFAPQNLNEGPVLLIADEGVLELEGGSVNLGQGYLLAERGPLSFTGSATFRVTILGDEGTLSLGGGAAQVGSYSVVGEGGDLLLGGGAVVYGKGLIADEGTLLLGGGDSSFGGSLVTEAEPGTLTFVAQSGILDMLLTSSPGELLLTGASVALPQRLFADGGGLAIVGAEATLISTDQDALNAEGGDLLLGPGTINLTPTLGAGGGTLLLAGTISMLVSSLMESGSLSLDGADLVFDADVVVDADGGTIQLTGAATFDSYLLASAGGLSLVGSDASLVTTQLASVTADSGDLLLSGEVSFLITGLTWEGDDATWGGSIALFGETLPVFVIGQEFFQAGNATAFGQDPIEVVVERTGLTVVGVDREGRPRANPDVLKLMREIWPVIRGTPGTIINIYAGGQEQIEGGITWQGPFPFVIGQDKSVQPLAEGVYLAVRFHSIGQRPWHLVSYDLDVVQLGEVPR